MRKNLLFILLVFAHLAFCQDALSNELTTENARQIKSRETIAAENAHIQDALSPLPKENEKIEENEEAKHMEFIDEDIENEKLKALEELDDDTIIYTTRTTPISIVHEGTDDLGIRFAMRLKSELNQSSLFTLEEGRSKPKISLILTTISEFKDRPAMGSAYALVWVFVHDANTLQYYLDQEVGVFTANEIDGLVAKIMDRADGFAVLYNYLF